MKLIKRRSYQIEFQQDRVHEKDKLSIVSKLY